MLLIKVGGRVIKMFSDWFGLESDVVFVQTKFCRVLCFSVINSIPTELWNDVNY